MVDSSAVSASAILFTNLCSLLLYRDASVSEDFGSNGDFSANSSLRLDCSSESTRFCPGELKSVFSPSAPCVIADRPLEKSSGSSGSRASSWSLDRDFDRDLEELGVAWPITRAERMFREFIFWPEPGCIWAHASRMSCRLLEGWMRMRMKWSIEIGDDGGFRWLAGRCHQRLGSRLTASHAHAQHENRTSHPGEYWEISYTSVPVKAL